MDTSETVWWLANSILQKCQRLNNNPSVIQIVKAKNGTVLKRENGKDKHDDVFDKMLTKKHWDHGMVISVLSS